MISPTITQFCHQVWQLDSTVQLFEKQGSVSYVVADKTPFHPVSHIWPDHPADTGRLVVGEQDVEVFDSLVGAIELSTGQLYVDKAIPVKRDSDGWVFVVVHCVHQAIDLSVGQLITLCVDKERQLALSRGHSAGHLAYLALNKVLADGYWRKDADRKDPHGHYDFNSYAQETSFVTEDKCVDSYRLGKTLRKRGLNSAEMLQDLASIESRVNAQLSDWLSLSSIVEMHCDGETLTDSRYWRCNLQEGEIAEIPCGGTHVTSLNEFARITVSLCQIDGQNVEMHTDVIPT
ncbi:alanyl-tRNA editing protein [Vibrio paucivorans]|uniref:Alanyl-tRNA editing protein n=1 Tax=Vibrio paucivorans TaxID=2829489 RepID=A0A9X3HSN5_9VIBR|nr:alanyl-tRNA editing protein [Vibrio paucivorans]MCW8334946.1 alanyl-tRNA editing protein [Vibrio paucivorans]